jgi:hypothetical protein
MNVKTENSKNSTKNKDFNSTASTKKDMFFSLNNFSVAKKNFDSSATEKNDKF